MPRRTVFLLSPPHQVSGLEMRKWMDELFPIIMDMLQDSSSLAKRQVGAVNLLCVFSSGGAVFKQNLSLTFHQVALWTLGQQVASTGYVVEPYRKYPSLLEVLLNFLKTEQNQGIRREVCMCSSWLLILCPFFSATV